MAGGNGAGKSEESPGATHRLLGLTQRSSAQRQLKRKQDALLGHASSDAH